MKVYNYEISTLEIPNEISLCFNIIGCNVKCKDCHSKFLWDINNGWEMDLEYFSKILEKYSSYISCICFMGGEWLEEDLITMLKISKENGLKTCLFTGRDKINTNIQKYLDLLKVGRFIKKLGGLESKITNQKMIDLKTGNCINYLYQNKN